MVLVDETVRVQVYRIRPPHLPHLHCCRCHVADRAEVVSCGGIEVDVGVSIGIERHEDAGAAAMGVHIRAGDRVVVSREVRGDSTP